MGAEEVAPNVYISKHPLPRGRSKSWNGYLGSVVGQAVLAAVSSSGPGFSPNSVHSLFLKPISMESEVTWKVVETATGKTFCHRNVKAYQRNDLVYMANVSLTRKNCYSSIDAEYTAYVERLRERRLLQSQRDRVEHEQDIDDDNEDEKVISKPFYFETPYPDVLKKVNLEKSNMSSVLKHQLSSKDISIEVIEANEQTDEAESVLPRINCFARLGQNSKIDNHAFQFVALAVLLDISMFSNLQKNKSMSSSKFFAGSVNSSLNQTLYIHDTNFDCTHWFGYSVKQARSVNDRIILEAEIFNDEGFHVATVIQEGHIGAKNLDRTMKL